MKCYIKGKEGLGQCEIITEHSTAQGDYYMVDVRGTVLPIFAQMVEKVKYPELTPDGERFLVTVINHALKRDSAVDVANKICDMVTNCDLCPVKDRCNEEGICALMRYLFREEV